MPRTNTAAKKAARERQQKTGEPYALARREVAQGPRDWLVGLEPGDDDRLPYDFVVDPQGRTYGLTDHGIIIGFTDSRESRQIAHYWSEVRDDPTAMVGKWMVTMDRFKNGWSTWHSAVRNISMAIPRAQRAEFMGGDITPSEGYEASLLHARSLRDRGPLFEEGDERTLMLNLLAHASGPDRWVEVDGDWLVRDVDTMEMIGRLEHATDFEGNRIAPEKFKSAPHLLIGSTLTVWASDRERPGLPPVAEVWIN